jgi:hypothetical protein
MRKDIDSIEKEKADLWGIPNFYIMILSISAADRGIAATAVQRDHQLSSDRLELLECFARGGSAVLVR